MQEHHLQRAITAQQIYGEANRRIIPTPEAMFVESDTIKCKRKEYSLPKQLIHVQGWLKAIIIANAFIYIFDLSPHIELAANTIYIFLYTCICHDVLPTI